MKKKINTQFAPMSPLFKDYVMNDTSWKADLPNWLLEIKECSQNTPYAMTFTLVARILEVLAQRAIEINDPALNIIMLHLSLYDGSHTKEAQEQINIQRERIKLYQQESIKTKK